MNPKRSLVCTGDIAGTSIDVFEYCGMGHLTEEQKNEVLESVAEAQLLEESGAEVVDVKRDDVSSSINDWEYEIYSEDEDNLKFRLQIDICLHLGLLPTEQIKNIK